jgi:hypothetical protein
MTASAVAGFAAGTIASGSVQGGIQGAFSGAVFAGVGDFLNAEGAFARGTRYGERSVMGVTTHAVAGCVTSVTAGGKCGSGALSAGLSQAALPFKPNDAIGGTIASMIIGGTASVLGGGKFANGARTGALAYIFNCARHVSCWKVPNDGEANFYRYGTPGNGEGSYAQSRALSVIYDMDSKWGEVDSRRVGVGNVSLENDSVFPPHSSHRDGLQIDIRPIRLDGRELPVDWRASQYDREATQKLVDILRGNQDVVRIFFNDPKIRACRHCKVIMTISMSK